MNDYERAEWDVFLTATKHIRYKDTNGNWTLLNDFLVEHGLDFNRAALHFAYVSLCDALELTPFAEPIVVDEPGPAPAPTAAAPSAAPATPAIPTAPASLAQREPTIWRNGKVIPYTNAVRL